MRILVAYDSKNGSTVEVAQAIADHLQQAGESVSAREAAGVRDVSEYDAFVVGAPLYAGAWLHGAPKFLKRHRDALSARPVAVFALGPRRDDAPEDWVRPREQFERALGKYDWLSPVSTALFGGADPPGKEPRRDIRDWDAIGAWASEVLLMLRHGGAAG